MSEREVELTHTHVETDQEVSTQVVRLGTRGDLKEVPVGPVKVIL